MVKIERDFMWRDVHGGMGWVMEQGWTRRRRCEGGIKVRGALVVVGFVLALLIGVAWLGHRDRGAGMPGCAAW